MNKQKVVNSYPPNYETVVKHFPAVEKMNNVVFSYGDIVYAPNATPIPDHLAVHEYTHKEQQGDDVEGWWDRYLVDKQFRFSQECEAYANQVMFIQQNAGKKAAQKALHFLAKDLASPMYALDISFYVALQGINKRIDK